MKLVWTDHAMQRVSERFPDQGWRRIPERKILRKAETIEYGDAFFVRQGNAKYVLKKRLDSIIVLTVLPAK